MNITIEPLNKDNWLPVCHLSVTEEQKQIFPVPNVYWIGISRYEEGTELFAIIKDGEYAGLVGCGYDEDGISGCINPLMVDARYQRQGIAYKAMELAVKYLIEKLHVKAINIGHRKENISAAALYEKLGFIITGESDKEFIRTLYIGENT